MERSFWVVDHHDALDLASDASAVAQRRIDDPGQPDCGLVAINVMPVPHDGGDLVAAVTLRLMSSDGAAKSPSVNVANNKSLTALNYREDTVVYGQLVQRGIWTLADVLAAQAARPYFTPWGGGVLGYKDGKAVVAVSVSGLSPEGDDAVAREALRRCGYDTVDPAQALAKFGGDYAASRPLGKTRKDLGRVAIGVTATPRYEDDPTGEHLVDRASAKAQA